jgi:aspartyl-tRNA(Asn)/glutamyl-tRNA(Gln) amidotransferase subunit B
MSETESLPSLNQDHLIPGQMGYWEVVIGLEVHAQVLSKAKLFSGAATQFGADPNTQVDFLDAGIPGTLPVINSYCIDQAIKTSIGLNGTVHLVSVFDRKNYFYADLPLGYQISQFHRPIMTQGFLDIDIDHKTKRIDITRLHLEIDAGKSTHDLDPHHSYIDFNRAGIALMEIVSEPNLRTAQEAMAYVKKLRMILRYLNTCDGNMEQGSLRVDANISLRRPGAPLGSRAEIKNVNSVRFLGQAIEYEIGRQKALLEAGEKVVQETRLFDAAKGVTRSMRSKEDAQDYRYFPDPDLPPLVLSQHRVDTIRALIPELPDAKKQRFVSDFGLSSYDADVLVAEQETANFFEKAIDFLPKDYPQGPKILANWMTGEVFGAMNRMGISRLENLPFSIQDLAQLVELILASTISGNIAKDIFAKMLTDGHTPHYWVDQLGLRQISDRGDIETKVQEVLDAHPTQAQEYRSGKIQILGFLVGQVMKSMKGKGNPQVINDILREKLDA